MLVTTIGFVPLAISDLRVGLNVGRASEQGILDCQHCPQFSLHHIQNYWFVGSKMSYPCHLFVQDCHYLQQYKQIYPETQISIQWAKAGFAKITAFRRGTETVVWNTFSYQVTSIIRTNPSTKKNHKFYNETVYSILYLKKGECFEAI